MFWNTIASSFLTPVFIGCTVRVAAATSIKVVGVSQPKLIHGFSPNFQGMFTQEDLELNRFLVGGGGGESGTNYSYANTFKIFGS